ncbi:MAG: HU family DNA-binding protein [Nitrospinaceae bacterium]|nr:MAG: HU family DNA-binding protein [Nitrospinaceae bacterium]
MTRSDLTTKLSLRMKVSKKEADKYLTAFLDAIMESLESEGRVVMQGFGSFRLNEHKARMAKKPITGEPIYLPVRKKPVFHAGKELREIINGQTKVSRRSKAPVRVKEPRGTYDNVHGIHQVGMPE